MGSLRLGDIAPDFEQDSSVGRIRFHEWLGNNWGVLISPQYVRPNLVTPQNYQMSLPNVM